MAPPTIDQTLALTEEDIDAIVFDNNRQDLFVHLENAGIQFSDRDPTVRLAKELRRYVCGDDDDSSAIDMAAIMAAIKASSKQLKEELATSSERLER